MAETKQTEQPANKPQENTKTTSAKKSSTKKKTTQGAKSGTAASTQKKKSTSTGTSSEKKQSAPKPKKQTSAQKDKDPETAEKTERDALPAVLQHVTEEPPHGETEPVPAIDFPTDQKRRLLWRAVLLLTVIAVLAASSLIFFFRPNNYTTRLSAVNFLYNATNDTTTITVNGSKREEVSGSLMSKAYDGRGRVCVALISGRLYCIRGKNVTLVAETVSDYVLSADGGAFAWRTTDNVLYYAQTRNPTEGMRVSSGVTTPYYTISPDGKELLYTSLQNGTLYLDGFTRSNSRPGIALSTGLYPVAVANRCKYFYCMDENGAFYVIRGKDGEPVLCGTMPQNITFNRDLSEVLFSENDGMRLWKRGKAVNIENVPAGTQLLPNAWAERRALPAGEQILQKTFLKQYYAYKNEDGDGYTLAYLTRKKLTQVSEVDRLDTVTVTDKGVYFLKTGYNGEKQKPYPDLYRCPAGKTAATELVRDVRTYAANSDGSRLLYIDHRDMLWSLKPGKAPVNLLDNMPVSTGITASVGDIFYFYRAPGELWVSDNGDTPYSVESNVSALRVDAHTALYLSGVLNDATAQAMYRNRRKGGKIEHIARVN